VAVRGSDTPAVRPSASIQVTSTSLSSPPPVGVSEVGHPVLEGPDSWDLYLRQPGSVLRVQLNLGRITRTEVPSLGSSGPVSLIATSGGVLVRPLDNVPGYVVPDGRPVQPLTGPLATEGPFLPGPDGAHVWVPDGRGAMTLTGLDGRASGVTVTLPSTEGSFPEPDGAGYPLQVTGNGVYAIRPSGVRLVTPDRLLAVGAKSWVTSSCDSAGACTTTLVDQHTDHRAAVLHEDGDWADDAGLVAPDSTVAGLARKTSNGLFSLHLVGLVADTDFDTGIGLDEGGGHGSDVLAWTPDSQWLLVVGSSGRLFAVARQSPKVLDLGIDGNFVQLALRAG
jgi:hypothetical protein